MFNYTQNLDNIFGNYYAAESQNQAALDWNMFKEQPKMGDDYFSFEDIKSTEEITAKDQSGSSCLSNIADENEHVETVKPVKTTFAAQKDEFSLIITPSSDSHADKLIDDLCNDVRSKINSSSISDIIDEAIGFEGEDQINVDFSPIIQVKHKKTSSQKVHLEAALKENPEWSSEFQKKLAQDLGLTKRQVYKWFWDKTKKKKNAC